MSTTVSNAPLENYTVAAEVIASRQYQSVKLIDGTVGSTTPVGTESNPLYVAPVSPVEVKSALISEASSGSNLLVAAVTGKRIQVISGFAIASGTVIVQFLSAATPLSGTMDLASSGGFVLPYNPDGWFETAVGEALNINLSGAVNLGGALKYREID